MYSKFEPATEGPYARGGVSRFDTDDLAAVAVGALPADLVEPEDDGCWDVEPALVEVPAWLVSQWDGLAWDDREPADADVWDGHHLLVRDVAGDVDIAATLKGLLECRPDDTPHVYLALKVVRAMVDGADQMLDVIAVQDMLMNWMQGQRDVDIAVYSDAYVATDIARGFVTSTDSHESDRAAGMELAAVLGVGQNQAHRMIADMRAITRWYPEVLVGLWDGDVTSVQAQALLKSGKPHLAALVAAGERDRAIDVAGEFARMALKPTARGRASTSLIGDRVNRIAARMNAKAPARRHARAVARRGVVFRDNHDGTTTVEATLTDIDALIVRRILEGMARDEDRSIPMPEGVRIALEAQAAFDEACGGTDFAKRMAKADAVAGRVGSRPARLADLLVDLITRAEQLMKGPSPKITLEVGILIPVETLAGGDEPAAALAGALLPADLARQLAEDSQWRAFLTTKGVVTDMGRARFPSAAMRMLVKSRHPRCTAPGCDIPSPRCDIDHAREHRHGGTTDPSNLHPASRGCHTVKTAGYFHVEVRPDGAVDWVSTTTGRTYTAYAEDWTRTAA